MEATSLVCPSCGGSVELANRFVKMVVCGYCGNTLAVENDRLDPTGKAAALVDYPTRFRIGQTGKLRSSPFRILGRVRLEDEDGYWDEWYLQFDDGSIAWLEEEEGEYTLSRKTPLTSAVPDFDAARVGATITVNNQRFFITEKCRARISGAEGQLYYKIRINQPVRFLDGNLGGRLGSVEYGESEIEYTTGEVIAREEVLLNEA